MEITANVRVLVLAGTAAIAACDYGTSRVLGPRSDLEDDFVAAIAFVSDRAGAPRIYLASEDGASVRLLVAGGAPAWSWDGTRIAFSRLDEGQAIYVIDADGSNERLVAFGRDPAWIPGDAELMYAAEGGIFAIALAGPAQPRKLVDDDLALPRPEWWVADTYDPGWLEAPAFSPDGSRVAFLRADPFNWDWGAARNAYIVVADGSEPRLLGGTCPIAPPGEGGLACPVETAAWSPDGSSLAVVTYVVDSESVRRRVIASFGSLDGELSGVSYYGEYVTGPQWSPDGSRITFSDDPLGDSDDRGGRIFSLDVETGSVRQLIPDVVNAVRAGYFDWQPVWRPTPAGDPCIACWDY